MEESEFAFRQEITRLAKTKHLVAAGIASFPLRLLPSLVGVGRAHLPPWLSSLCSFARTASCEHVTYAVS